LIISYLTLRRSLGLFGVLLPLVLVLGDSLTVASVKVV
jgi:hypothetical protein